MIKLTRITTSGTEEMYLNPYHITMIEPNKDGNTYVTLNNTKNIVVDEACNDIATSCNNWFKEIHGISTN